MITILTVLNLTTKQVSVSAKLYDFIHFLWLNEAPVGELQWDCGRTDVMKQCTFASAILRLKVGKLYLYITLYDYIW